MVYNKEYYEKNKDRFKEYNRNYNEIHKEKLKQYKIKYRLENKDNILKKVKEYREKNKDKIKEYGIKFRLENKEYFEKYHEKYSKNYYEKNKEKLKQYQLNYYKNKDKEKHKLYYKKYHFDRYHQDIQYNIRNKLRILLNQALKLYTQEGKTLSSKKYGIDWKQVIIKLMNELPQDFEERKNTDNPYSIDHITPLSSFDLSNSYEIKKAFSPENHQWLLFKENCSKGDKFDESIY